MQLNVMLQKHSDSCFGSEWFRGHVSPGNPGTGSPTAEILPAGVGELSNHKQLAHRLTVWVLSFLSLCWEISGALRCWALSICTHWKGQWLGWLPEIQTPCSGIQWNLYTRNNLRQNYGCREPGVRGGILFCRWKNTRFMLGNISQFLIWCWRRLNCYFQAQFLKEQFDILGKYLFAFFSWRSEGHVNSFFCSKDKMTCQPSAC